MLLKRLTLSQMRAYDQAEFDFTPGMNLIVGINGAGKSTVLDAMRLMLSQSLPQFTASRSKPIPFETEDITAERGALTAELAFDAAGINFKHLIRVPRAAYVIDPARAGEVREQTYDLIERNELEPPLSDIPAALKKQPEQPLAIYFSTYRSYPIDRQPSRQSSASGQAAAFVDALTHRELNIRMFAEWWLVQEELARESPTGVFARRMAALDAALGSFLNQYTNLRAVRQPKTTLLVDKHGATLDVRQLSDGERSMIALVFDLARRLAQANPKLPNPLRDGKAVVLIDELDLHLHPSWQRSVARKLTTTFPNCQFIATTHSPQIIGEVPPEQIIILEQGKQPYRPDQSLGMDSNWVLKYLMDTSSRSAEVNQELERIAGMIEEEQYDQASAALDSLQTQLGEFPELIRLQTRIARIRQWSE